MCVRVVVCPSFFNYSSSPLPTFSVFQELNGKFACKAPFFFIGTTCSSLSSQHFGKSGARPSILRNLCRGVGKTRRKFARIIGSPIFGNNYLVNISIILLWGAFRGRIANERSSEVVAINGIGCVPCVWSVRQHFWWHWFRMIKEHEII